MDKSFLCSITLLPASTLTYRKSVIFHLSDLIQFFFSLFVCGARVRTLLLLLERPFYSVGPFLPHQWFFQNPDVKFHGSLEKYVAVSICDRLLCRVPKCKSCSQLRMLQPVRIPIKPFLSFVDSPTSSFLADRRRHGFGIVLLDFDNGMRYRRSPFFNSFLYL